MCPPRVVNCPQRAAARRRQEEVRAHRVAIKTKEPPKTIIANGVEYTYVGNQSDANNIT